MATTQEIRAAAQAGRTARAEALLAELIAEVADEPADDVRLNRDQYSLNSVNGFARLRDTGDVFFKFHQEEDEDRVSEYYNARILAEAGYAVDRPLVCSGAPGKQILIYRRRSTPRFSEVCRELEFAAGDAAFERAVAAQRDADAHNARIAVDTLHTASAAAIAAEPVFQLFHHRLVDGAAPADGALGGRARRFYVDGVFRLDGTERSWAELAHKPWRINGRRYPATLAGAFAQAAQTLAPAALAPGPAVVAHGDAHNANVWYESDGDGGGRLVLFDPAFAGRHVPALLAEVKATFHNIFAHPFWLYEPDAFAGRYRTELRVEDAEIAVETDWELSPLRQRFLESKAEAFWRPLLAALEARGELAPDWARTVRSALFACPTLVMDLTAGPESRHNPASAATGLAVAMMCAAPPATGDDPVSRLFAALRPDGAPPPPSG